MRADPGSVPVPGPRRDSPRHGRAFCGMTRMSEPRRARARHARRNPATNQVNAHLAHRLHAPAPLVRIAVFSISLAVGVGACVIPPSLEVDNQDAGVNSPPAILAIRAADAELPEPGPVLFERGTGMFNAELIDTDLDDRLFVRAFVDYTIDDPENARVLCTAPPEGKPTRTVTCDTSALCRAADVGQTRNLQILVFDREPLESGSPPFQAMPAGGLSTGKFYFLQCTEPAP